MQYPKAALQRALKLLSLTSGTASHSLVDITQVIDGTVAFEAFNSKVAMRVSIQDLPKSDSIGSQVVVEAGKLSRIVELCEEDVPVSMTRVKSELVITSGKAEWRLPVRAIFDQFPTDYLEERTFYDRIKFMEALKVVNIAVSKTQENLKIIQIKNQKVRAAGEGRVHQMDLEGFPVDMEIPAAAVPIIVAVLNVAKTDNFAFSANDKEATFHVSNGPVRIDLMVKKSAYKFQDVENALLRPAFSNNRRLGIDVGTLGEAVRRVRVNAGESSAIRLDLRADTLVVSAQDAAGNKASVSLACEWTYEPATIVVNHRHLTDGLTYMSDGCIIKLAEDSRTVHSSMLLNDPVIGHVVVLPQMNKEML